MSLPRLFAEGADSKTRFTGNDCTNYNVAKLTREMPTS